MLTDNKSSDLPVAVLGAGPVGLAAAAHLLERGLRPLILEAGEEVGEHLRRHAHVELFSPWKYNLDAAAVRRLTRRGWLAPDPEGLPSAGALRERYLLPLAADPAVAAALHTGHRVIGVSREGMDKIKSAGREQAPFLIRCLHAGEIREFRARAVLDARGTWGQPNPLGANGLPAVGERENADWIDYGMPDIASAPERYAGTRVLVVGAGHSAAGSLMALAKLAEHHPGGQILWAVRGENLRRVFGGGAQDQLPARGELGLRLRALQETGQLQLLTGFRIGEVSRVGSELAVSGLNREQQTLVLTGLNRIIVATGARPELDSTRELRLHLDPWLEASAALAPLIDPNHHSCGSVPPHGHRQLAHPEPGYYAVGARSYGRAPNFLMATGYEQVRSVVAALAGDTVAADAVHLQLPETGVCESRPTPAAEAPEPGCCGGPAPAGVSACCVRDAEAKLAGEAGCGCTTASEQPDSSNQKQVTACCG